MVIFELPPEPDRPAIVALAVGSCRITVPIRMLPPRGELHIREVGLQATHSSAEAAQALAFAAGELSIPENLSPYVFGPGEIPRPGAFARSLRDGVDAVIVEISDDRQFMHGETRLQMNFVASRLVRPYGPVLLDWFRALCGGRAVDEARVRSALEKLTAAGHRPDDTLIDLLRNIRLTCQDEAEITAELRSMMARWGGRWTVVGATEIPARDGGVMKRRRALNEKLGRAARASGAAFYDPSELIDLHGRVKVLDGDGANIHEYAKDFRPVVRETLLNLARGAPRDAGAASVRHAATRAAAFEARSRLADRVNGELLTLHRRRSMELGIEESGLGAHYRARVKGETLVGERERGVLELIWTYLPAYEAYAVMRAGLGEMALLLAASGRRTLAFEPYKHRRAAIEAGRTRLEAAGLLAPGTLTVLAGLTPREPFEGRVLGMGLDVAHFQTDEDAEPHFCALAHFDALLVDLHALLRLRAEPEDQEAAARRIGADGFMRRRDYSVDNLTWFQKAA